MTQISYYGTPEPPVPHRAGLIAWGSVLIAGGALLSCLGLFGMVMVAFVSVSGIGGIGGGANKAAVLRGLSAMLVAIGLYGSLIWIGIGCCQGKRWVRPLVLVGSVIAITTGVVSIVPMSWTVLRIFSQTMAAPPTTAPAFGPGATAPPVFAAIGGIVGVMMAIAMMLVVPGCMFHFFRRETVRQSLEMTDPRPRWTDNIPLPLLGWVVASVMFGFGDILAGLNGIYPFFDAIITGPIVAGAMAVIGMLLIAGGWLSYRRSMLGWLLSITVSAFMGASLLTFSIVGDSRRYREMIFAGFGAAMRHSAAYSASDVSPVLVPAMMSIVMVGFGIWLRPRVPR
jgi:hypothetical protein